MEQIKDVVQKTGLRTQQS